MRTTASLLLLSIACLSTVVVAEDPTSNALSAIASRFEPWQNLDQLDKAIKNGGKEFDAALDKLSTKFTEGLGSERQDMGAKLLAIAVNRRAYPDRYEQLEQLLSKPRNPLEHRLHYVRDVPQASPYATEEYRLAWEYWLLRPHREPGVGPAPMPAVLVLMKNEASLLTLEHLFFLSCKARNGWNDQNRIELIQAIGGFRPETVLSSLLGCLQQADAIGDGETLNVGELILRSEKFRPLLEKQPLASLSSNVIAVVQRARTYQPPPEAPPPPPKPDYFRPMLQELRDLGYNLELDDETYDRIRDDLVKYVWTETEEMFNAGKISRDEMEREQARRYKEWFLKHLQPTLPPKTSATATPVAPASSP